MEAALDNNANKNDPRNAHISSGVGNKNSERATITGGGVAGIAFYYCGKTQIPIGSLHLYGKGVYLDYGTCNTSSSPKIRDIAYNDY